MPVSGRSATAASREPGGEARSTTGSTSGGHARAKRSIDRFCQTLPVDGFAGELEHPGRRQVGEPLDRDSPAGTGTFGGAGIGRGAAPPSRD